MGAGGLFCGPINGIYFNKSKSFIFPVHLLIIKYVIMQGQNLYHIAVVKVLDIKTPQLFLPSQYIT